jgi:hypothetical protein
MKIVRGRAWSMSTADIRNKMKIDKLEKENKALKQVHVMNFVTVTYFFAGFFLLLAFFFAATKLRLRRVVFNNS